MKLHEYSELIEGVLYGRIRGTAEGFESQLAMLLGSLTQAQWQFRPSKVFAAAMANELRQMLQQIIPVASARQHTDQQGLVQTFAEMVAQNPTNSN